ncbi:hypothetical protein GW17_00011475 [Ensete ventricosum]|nr:hypothetical protein GW17_00011475 [Ensete ventricosum]
MDSNCGKTCTAWYIPVRQLTDTRTGRYRAVPLRAAVSDRFRPSTSRRPGVACELVAARAALAPSPPAGFFLPTRERVRCDDEALPRSSARRRGGDEATPRSPPGRRGVASSSFAGMTRCFILLLEGEARTRQRLVFQRWDEIALVFQR